LPFANTIKVQLSEIVPLTTNVAVFVTAIAVEEAKRAKARRAVDNFFMKKIL
jgi:hypothetical protein